MKIAISTGGGDAPGLNAVIRAVVLSAHQRGWESYGIHRGYDGLFPRLGRGRGYWSGPERRRGGSGDGLVRLGPDEVRGITHLGGTILGTTNRGDPFHWPTLQRDGGIVEEDRSDDLVRAFERDHDDYSAIVAKALADRLAEAFAASLHSTARREWGIAESASVEDVIAERHRGIRPAFGYPACPDHSEKFKLFDLLGARDVGIDLTESAAMWPAASVSGLYFANPGARYFTVGRVGEDQIASYARRKRQSIEQVERWLTPNLGYEPVRC